MNQVLDRPVKLVEDVEPPPPTILYGWFMMPNERIAAARFENHPRMGSGKNLITSKIMYLDEVIGIAKSKNTFYILKDQIK